MTGGTGNDTFYVDSLSDQVIENQGGGTDTAVVTVNSYWLTANVENGTVGTTTGLNLIGTSSDNVITGNAGNDLLQGAQGNDTIYGLGGSDTIYGGVGDDTIDGGVGNDLLDGKAGNDILTGGAGNDTLTGGGNNDTFVFKDGYGKDTVSDFMSGQDIIDLTGIAGWDDFSDVQLHAAQVGSNVVITVSDADSITLSGRLLDSLQAQDFLLS